MIAGRRGRLVRAVRGWLRRHTWLAGAAGVAAVAVAVAGLFGGLRAVGTDAVAEVAVGDAIDAGPWEVRVDRVRAVDDFPTLSHVHADDRWIAVVVTMTNTTSETAPAGAALAQSLTVRAFPGQRETVPHVVLVSDGSRGVQLVPGLPEQVAFFWEQDAAEPMPASLDVVIVGYGQRRDAFSDVIEWKDPAPVAELTAPVTRGEG